MSTLRVNNIKSRTSSTVTIPDGESLTVTGDNIISGSQTIGGTQSVTGSQTISGNSTVTGTLTVSGGAVFNNPSGSITTGTLNIGTFVIDDLTVNNSASFPVNLAPSVGGSIASAAYLYYVSHSV